MLKPSDIANKEFKKSIMGYNKLEVDKFLNEIINDYQLLINKIGIMEKELESYQKYEKNLKDTIEMAKEVNDKETNLAKIKADTIIKEAINEKEKIMIETNKNIEYIKKTHKKLLEESIVFKTRYKNFLKSQIDILEDFYAENSEVYDSEILDE